MVGSVEEKANWAGWIMLGLLGALSLACIVAGGIFYVWIVVDWALGSRSFAGLQMIGWIFGLIAAAVIGVGLVLAGVLLRLVRWNAAPLVSLALSIVSTGFILVTYLVFSNIDTASSRVEVVALQGACIVCLFIVGLPPFLHWLLARRRPTPVMP